MAARERQREAGIANLPTVSSGNFPELMDKGKVRDRVAAYVEGKEVRWMVEIRLAKCLLVLTEQELRSLLGRDPELWMTAIRRGKAVMRQRQEEARGPKHIGEILPKVLTDIERRYLKNNEN